MTPSIREAADALARTVAAYSAATHQGIDRPLFWHVDGMRQVRALLAALEADAALATRQDAPTATVDVERLAWESLDGRSAEAIVRSADGRPVVALSVREYGRRVMWTAEIVNDGSWRTIARGEAGDAATARQAAAEAAAQLARDVLAALAPKAAP